MRNSRTKCNACGKKLIDHSGIQVTCKQLRIALIEIEVMKKLAEIDRKVMDLQDKKIKRLIGELDAAKKKPAKKKNGRRREQEATP